MSEMELLKMAWALIKEYGPNAATIISDIIQSVTPTKGVTFCGKCGAECEAHQIKVNGKLVFMGKCPTHGFER